MSKEFKISVVMPIYNVEKYLEEAIESVVNQTIGFKDNIQLILVNDGSPDNSESICLKYKKDYPENIFYIKQENSGVSAARNRGKKEATGKYLNFFDSDDIWDINTYQLVYDFFEENFEKIDVVSCRLEFFGSQIRSHPLNFKYKQDAIIDIDKNPDFIQLSASSAFIKTQKMLNINFDTSLAFSEDALLLTELIIERGYYGVIRDGIYYYRRREEDNSAIQSSSTSYSWYFDTPKKSYEYLINKSKKEHGKVQRYIQFYVMYELQWRLRKPFPAIFSDKMKKDHILIIKKLLQEIDDEVIFLQKNISSEYKLYALELKYDTSVNRELTIKERVLYYEQFQIHSLYNNFLLKINIINFENNHLVLDGQVRTILDERDYKIYAKDSKDNHYFLELKKNNLAKSYGIDRTVLYNSSFHVEIPTSEDIEISMYIQYKENDPIKLKMNFENNSKLSNQYYLTYRKNDKLLYNISDSVIKITKRDILSNIRSSARTLKSLLKNKKGKSIIIRLLVALSRFFLKKPIWIVSDSLSHANDNGYHFFKFVNEIEKRNVNIYFVLNKDSSDYEKMRKIGKVLDYNSLKYKVLFLLSDKIISSGSEDWVINPFKNSRELYKDLYIFDFVFLQHGVTKNDLSVCLNKLNKDIKLFVTSAIPEYDSIIKGDYGYTDKEVKLVGLPRFDNLIDNREKKVVIMPTWRKSLVGKDSLNIPDEREYSGFFKESDYFKFYNNLINNSKLLATFEEYGYSGELVIHPSHLKQDVDFTENNIFSINSGFADYQKYFNESSLLITDYSSVAMDFAYLNKPVIYCQFDKEYFFESQIYSEGYFEDERDGFGPVYNNLNDTVEGIIKKLKDGCIEEEKYRKRIDNFYKYRDQNNCQRVYDEIKKMNDSK